MSTEVANVEMTLLTICSPAAQVKRHHIATRENATVNRLNKTKREEKVDHEAVRQEREKERNRIKREEANKIVRTHGRIGLTILPHSLTCCACLSRAEER